VSLRLPSAAPFALVLLSVAASAGCPAQPEVPDTGLAPDGGPPSDALSFGDGGTCVTNDDCDDDLFCTDRERCVEGRCVVQATFCDDGVECTIDSCSEERRRCENVAPDADGDGVRDASCRDYRGVPLGDDCDDADPTRAPTFLEVCDAEGHDEDCDLTTFGGVDMDGDEFESDACCQRDAMGRLRCGDDCNDAVGSTNPLAPEICNGLDDDCDEIVDDIIHGNVVCARGDTRPCTTTCGVTGAEACNAGCLGWDSCVAAEVCNGCDDDNDAASDEDFECLVGTSRTCTTTCGTPGTQLCDVGCSYARCTASEACNYCDDDGDGNFFEERPLATSSRSVTFDRLCNTEAGGRLYGRAACTDESPPGQVLIWAQLLDGLENDQAGAAWIEMPTPMGWGAVELDLTLEVTAVSAGGDVEMPLGGWAIVLGRGTTGVGAPRDSGIPTTTITGVAARWAWSQVDTCFGMAPTSGDGLRGLQLGGVGLRQLRTPDDMTTTSSCYSGYDIVDGSDLNGPGGTVAQRMRLRYTPDDPTTPADEEALVITAGAGPTQSLVPSDALPLGTGPLHIGITAGTYTDRFGPSGPLRFGVPVRARVLVQRVVIPCCRPAEVSYPVQLTQAGVCP
jgi:hypothetical protein